jgi:FlaA1/EpsC-like NDP-sugar epimerase
MSNPTTRMSAVRFGNVFGSTGSVVPRFMKQIAQGGPVKVTHPEASRFFITLAEAVEIILRAVSLAENGVYVPKLGEPVMILDLAKRMIGEAEKLGGGQIQLEIVGLRPGEKLSEQLVSQEETRTATEDSEMHRVNGPRIEDAKLDAALAKLAVCVVERNLSEMLTIISGLVPDYVPSEALFGSSARLFARAKT